MCPDACGISTMTYAEAAAWCEGQGRQLCSVETSSSSGSARSASRRGR
eukprot:CAMPEP_0179165114 /NCGR_PEP_ID=MMETSP0796-20121207/81080_1 /TAXON_ID=73915 /ORGANISM="Pyrodinium bahamense, Strain pbaha01" /LENGTH=47 /DNA_ID= /DNA_START= /DNA_END= /DNA_ORIENTATION=